MGRGPDGTPSGRKKAEETKEDMVLREKGADLRRTLSWVVCRYLSSRCEIQHARRRSNKNRTLPGIVWKARPRARSIYAKKRPARCEGTISPDTFHLTDRANHRLTWSVFQTFAEIYGCQSASLQCPKKAALQTRLYFTSP